MSVCTCMGKRRNPHCDAHYGYTRRPEPTTVTKKMRAALEKANSVAGVGKDVGSQTFSPQLMNARTCDALLRRGLIEYIRPRATTDRPPMRLTKRGLALVGKPSAS